MHIYINFENHLIFLWPFSLVAPLGINPPALLKISALIIARLYKNRSKSHVISTLFSCSTTSFFKGIQVLFAAQVPFYNSEYTAWSQALDLFLKNCITATIAVIKKDSAQLYFNFHCSDVSYYRSSAIQINEVIIHYNLVEAHTAEPLFF